MKQKREDIRNIAIIAHVDHGKTTLVDELLKQSGTFRQNQVVAERVMDSGDIERERGITILSKNTSVHYNGVKINIIDTPGHADFGGEVERVLKMVNGVVLVVDAFEGPMPQTRFVLRKALDLDLPVVVCLNKVDRPEARPAEVVDEVLELFMELEASDDQLDSPFVYASARQGWASRTPDGEHDGMRPLFETILEHIPAPEGDPEAPVQTLISTIDYSEYVGRIGIGKVESGTLRVNDEVILLNHHNPEFSDRVKISKLYTFEGLNRVEAREVSCGDIAAISGIADIRIGDTICSPARPEALPFVKISEPTLSMVFSVNDSPFAGQEGKFVTSRHLRERLYKELRTDVSLRVEDTESTEAFRVFGRGELHLSILIETMRREGYEFQVIIDVPEEYVGIVIEKLGSRKGEMQNMTPGRGGNTRLEFLIPARGMIGYRGDFLTDTRGHGIMNSLFAGYGPYRGDIPRRSQGSLVAFETGESITYGLFNAQERGDLFIGPGVRVYEGMIIGRNARSDDMDVNVCKKKQLTNTRASGSDDALKLVTPITMSLEECLEFIADDELVEVTPLNLRMRKKILDNNLRRKARYANQKQ